VSGVATALEKAAFLRVRPLYPHGSVAALHPEDRAGLIFGTDGRKRPFGAGNDPQAPIVTPQHVKRIFGPIGTRNFQDILRLSE